MNLSKDVMTRLANLDPETLEKTISRAERAKASRFSKLVYNHYRQARTAYQVETAKKLLKENKIELPAFSQVEKDFEQVVIDKQKKLAENGNAVAIETLKQANIS